MAVTTCFRLEAEGMERTLETMGWGPIGSGGGWLVMGLLGGVSLVSGSFIWRDRRWCPSLGLKDRVG